ncbi:uncharacterized protein F5147DRAFT_693218 [Suillus discolor]|uniref:Uncharacterized protein n=1 Tax=Suillus discolor TaxID=1912936 RepID=A0A9P7JUS2_9AGAM|nr:uncharacterized protein F5147DRAFT_693218 [Suillus discolor]KAG2109404.1 hypothetical protein F5147DRAFT_693218 [Suillus discolor]
MCANWLLCRLQSILVLPSSIWQSTSVYHLLSPMKPSLTHSVLPLIPLLIHMPSHTLCHPPLLSLRYPPTSSVVTHLTTERQCTANDMPYVSAADRRHAMQASVTKIPDEDTSLSAPGTISEEDLASLVDIFAASVPEDFTRECPDDPTTYVEAMASPHATQWRLALQEEFDSLKQTGTYTLVPPSDVPRGRAS